MKKINLNDHVERNFFGISNDYAAQLKAEGCTIEYRHHPIYPSGEEMEMYLVYNAEGDLVEELTYEDILDR